MNDKKESSCDMELSRYWASLGDIFINDAFATSHRRHASNVGIASILPSGVGFLIEKELNNLIPVINNPTHPFTIILGGAKVSDKIGLIANLIDKCDYLLIGGGMAYTFLKAKGEEIGKSLCEDDYITYCQKLLCNNKIILPIDHVISENVDGKGIIKDTIDKNKMALDIGPKTIELFSEYVKKSKTIIWNGPLGMYEKVDFQNGTKKVCELFSANQTVIIGGGDSASAIINMGLRDKVTHISTGGGASLELLEGKLLPGIEVIK